jgi:lysophospholipase L1-like esterase
MKHCARVAMLAATLLVALLATASPAFAAKPAYLALGDSWAAGAGSTDGGYVPRLHQGLQEQFDCSPSDNTKPEQGCGQLELVDIAVGGATTPTLIANQLPPAVELLQARNSDENPRDNVEVVTVHIGGNDVTNPIIAACLGGLTANCLTVIQTRFATYRANLDTVLSTLRSAGGPDTRIVIGTYDNPIATCVLGNVTGAVQLGNIVLEGLPPFVPQGLNDIMRDVADDYGVEVADVFGDLVPQDWVGGNDCLHPDDSGYDKVTAEFLAVLTG